MQHLLKPLKGTGTWPEHVKKMHFNLSLICWAKTVWKTVPERLSTWTRKCSVAGFSMVNWNLRQWQWHLGCISLAIWSSYYQFCSVTSYFPLWLLVENKLGFSIELYRWNTLVNLTCSNWNGSWIFGLCSAVLQLWISWHLWLCLNIKNIICVWSDEAGYTWQLRQSERMGCSLHQEKSSWLQTWTGQVFHIGFANRLLNYWLVVSASFSVLVYCAQSSE